MTATAIAEILGMHLNTISRVLHLLDDEDSSPSQACGMVARHRRSVYGKQRASGI